MIVEKQIWQDFISYCIKEYSCVPKHQRKSHLQNFKNNSHLHWDCLQFEYHSQLFIHTIQITVAY